MDDNRRDETAFFEQEVQRIARALWPRAEFGGAAMVDGRETDGVFQTEDRIHIVEATISRRKSKAQDDIEKLTKSMNKARSRSDVKAIRGWFVTRDEPTAEQREVADKVRDKINTLSFS